MRNRERSAWKRVWACDAMRDKHEVRMSDMRPMGRMSPDCRKDTVLGRATVREKAPPNGHFSAVPSKASASYNSFGDQRCALLTMKSRKTCTRATVFNSSG